MELLQIVANMQKLKRQIEILSQIDPVNFMCLIGEVNVGPTYTSFADIIHFVDNCSKVKLLKPIESPEFLRELLSSGTLQQRMDIIICLDDKKRLAVMDKIPERTQARYLSYLRYVQEVERPEWPQRVLPALIKTGPFLPDYYPREMETCIHCKSEYKVWSTIISCDCLVHSFCEDCDRRKNTDGACPMEMEGGSNCLDDFYPRI